MAEDELKNNKNEGWNKENDNNNVLEFDSNGLELDKKNEDGSSLYSSDEELDVSDIAKGILNEYSNTQKEENKENVEVEQSSEISDNGNQEEVTKQENSEISRDVSSSNVSLSESEISDTSDDDISEDSQNSSKSKFSIKKKNTKEQINTRITKCVEEINETLKNDPLKPEDVEKINGLNKEIHDLVKNNLNIKDFLKSDNFTNIKNDDIKKVLRRSLIWSAPNIADRLVVRPLKGAYDVVRHPMHHKKIVLSVTSPVWVPLGIGAAGVAIGVGVPVAAVGIPSYGIYKGAKKIDDVRKGKSADKKAREEAKKRLEDGADIKQNEGEIKKEKHSNTKIMERYQKMTFKEILKKREKRIDKLSKFFNRNNNADGILENNSENPELSRAKRKVNIINTELLSKMASRNDVNDYKDLNLEQLIRMKSIANTNKKYMNEEIKGGLDNNKQIFMGAVAEKIKEGKTKGINAKSFKEFMNNLDKDEVRHLSDALENVNYKELNKKSLKIVMGVLAKQRENVKIDGGEINDLQNKMDEIFHYATRTKGLKDNVATKYIPDGVGKPQLHQGKDYSLLARALFNVEDRNMKTRDAMLDYLNQNIIKPNKEKDKVVFAELKNDNDKIMNKTSVKLDQNKYERYSVKELMEKRVKLTNEIIENYKEHNKNGFNVKNKLEQLVNIDNVLEKVINNTLNKDGVNIASVIYGMSPKALESLKELTEKMKIDRKNDLLDEMRQKNDVTIMDLKESENNLTENISNYDINIGNSSIENISSYGNNSENSSIEDINNSKKGSIENSIPKLNENNQQELPAEDAITQPSQPTPPAAPSVAGNGPAATVASGNIPPLPPQTPVVGNVPLPQQPTNVEINKSEKKSDAKGELGDIITDLSNKNNKNKQEERISQIIGALGDDAKGAKKINIIINGNDLTVQIEKENASISEKKVSIESNEVKCSEIRDRTNIEGFEKLYGGSIKDVKKRVKITDIEKEIEGRNKENITSSAIGNYKKGFVKDMARQFESKGKNLS